MKRGVLGIAGLAALAAMALPASAGATVVTLSNGNGIDFPFDDPSLSPGAPYPSTIVAPAGTVNDVNISVQESHANPDDLDVALVSPNGTAVHIFSDACGSDAEFQTLKFDDAAAIFLSDGGPCNQSLTYDVSNYAENPDIYTSPGPASTLNALSFFNGGPSGGTWQLFTMDDTTGNGGMITNWTLTLDFTPTPVVPTLTPIATQTPPSPPPPLCGGQPATKVGTEGPDVIAGSSGVDVIAGLGGNDRISGLGGKDILCGGAGNDKLTGGGGNDKLLGGSGKDTLKGGPGKDRLKGGPGKDIQIQ